MHVHAPVRRHRDSLVDEYARSSRLQVLVNSLIRIHTDTGGSEQAWAQVEGRVGRELEKLQYLINAAVEALRTPSSGSHGTVATCTAVSGQNDSFMDIPHTTASCSDPRITEAERQRQRRREGR